MGERRIGIYLAMFGNISWFMIYAPNWTLSSSLGTGSNGSCHGCHHIGREPTKADWLWLAETGRRRASSEDGHYYNHHCRTTEVPYVGPWDFDSSQSLSGQGNLTKPQGVSHGQSSETGIGMSSHGPVMQLECSITTFAESTRTCR